ncbi:MAG: phosphoethanolamine transferase [Synergistaceae bacterium]|nr:phosphoethanolamine transferase [Synergistaceae bacterium]
MEKKQSIWRMLLWQSGYFDTPEFDSHRRFIFWMFALGLTYLSRIMANPITALVDSEEIFRLIVDGLRILCVVIVLADIILHVLLHKFRLVHRIVKAVIIAAGIIMTAADLFMLWYWHRPFDTKILDIVLSARVNESFEFFRTYITDGGFILFIIGTVAAILIMYRLRKAVLLFTAIMIVTAFQEVIMFPAIFNAFYLTPRNANYLSIYRMASMIQTVRAERLEYRAILDGKPKEITLTRNDSSIPYTVFILGEATARNHMSLYGYHLPTTPRLDRRKQEGGLHVFTDVIAPHSYTVIVLEKLFNFYRYGGTGKWFTYTNIFSILKAAGVHTAWLSNQERNTFYYPGTLYSNACDFVAYVDTRYDWYFVRSYDGELLPLLDDVIEKSAEKNFCVLHLIGTHSDYSKRYPPEYAKFTASDMTGGWDGITDRQQQIRAEYDNAMLYNDFIVDEIIRRFEDKNAVVIYLSDHGQEVFDEYNFMSHGGEEPYRNIIEIPFVIWTSLKFRQAYPELEARIAASVNRPYMTDDMIHTLLDLMGIETAEYDPAKSVINPNFDSSRQRIYAGMLYDKDKGLHHVPGIHFANDANPGGMVIE